MAFYRHASSLDRRRPCASACSARPGRGPLPVLTYLAGLTCTEETFLIKAGAQRATPPSSG